MKFSSILHLLYCEFEKTGSEQKYAVKLQIRERIVTEARGILLLFLVKLAPSFDAGLLP